MAVPTSLLTHAITPLAFDRAKLHRERLVDMIHGFLPRKLIVMAAPPGRWGGSAYQGTNRIGAP